MKKTVLFTAALVAVSAVSAQTGEITSNRGENWLSQDGDWGLTFDATPMLNYAGNLFNNGNNSGVMSLNNLYTSQGARGHNDNSVMIGGKKLVDANTAYRAQVRIGFGSHKVTTETASLDPAAAANTMVEDATKKGYMAIDLGFGLEKRVGSTRVVGVYGGMFNVGFGSSKETREYGNSLEHTGSRITEVKDGGTFALGLSAFAGVEWFCAPKISLSGEYTWGLAMSSKGYNVTSWDRVSGDNAPTESNSGNKDNKFSLDTGINHGGTIGINFYFQ